MRLIQAIKVQTQCEDDRELRSLSSEQKERLANLIEERVPGGLAPIEEWNEVILSFKDTKTETDSQEAKNKLLSILREGV